jgi:hypothetical protein
MLTIHNAGKPGVSAFGAPNALTPIAVPLYSFFRESDARLDCDFREGLVYLFALFWGPGGRDYRGFSTADRQI